MEYQVTEARRNEDQEGMKIYFECKGCVLIHVLTIDTVTLFEKRY